MFERFTEDARQVVIAAQGESRQLGHDYIGCEHLLLGLTSSRGAGQVLEYFGITTGSARAEVARIVGGSSPVPTSGQIPFTRGAQHALEQAHAEALQLGSSEIDAGHLLLALVAEPNGGHLPVFKAFGVSVEAIRQEVLRSEQDPKQREGRAKAERSPGPAILYHATTPTEADRIARVGFRDRLVKDQWADWEREGVWLCNAPFTFGDSVGGQRNWLIAIEIPEQGVAQYEVNTEDVWSREFVAPAEIVNRYPVLWSRSYRTWRTERTSD